MTLKFRRFDKLDAVPLDAKSWNRLVDRADIGSVFQRYHWTHSWWQHFGRPYKLCFVCALEDRQVIAFAPMMIDSSRTLRFIGDLNSDYLGFVIPAGRPEMVVEFVGALHEHSDEWRNAYLRNIPHESDLNQTIADACQALKLFSWLNYTESAPFLPISGNDDGIDSLLNKYRIRRSIRQVEAQGNLQFVEIRDAAGAEPFWRMFSDQHLGRSKEQDRKSPFSDSAYLDLLRTAFECDENNDEIHFSAILLDNRPIAFHFGFISQNRLLWYKPSFDTSIRKGSPGIVLICALIRSARDKGYCELDFTIGDEPFKDRFCSDKRKVHSYRIYKSRFAYTADRYYWRLRSLIKRIVR